MTDNDNDFLPDYSGRKLSDKDKRRIIRETLPEFITKDSKAKPLYDKYVNSGISINRREFYDIFSEVTGGGKSAYNIRFVSKTKKPSEQILKKAFYPLKGQYRFVATLTVQDDDTEEIKQITFNLDTDKILSIGEIEDKIATIFQESDSGKGRSVIGSKILRGYKR